MDMVMCSDPKERVGAILGEGGSRACVLGGGNVRMHVCRYMVKQLSPFMCVKCVCEWRGQKGFP